jgi:uncharacterized membrane protein YgcG
MLRCIYSFASTKGKYYGRGERISKEQYNTLTMDEKTHFVDEDDEAHEARIEKRKKEDEEEELRKSRARRDSELDILIPGISAFMDHSSPSSYDPPSDSGSSSNDYGGGDFGGGGAGGDF